MEATAEYQAAAARNDGLAERRILEGSAFWLMLELDKLSHFVI